MSRSGTLCLIALGLGLLAPAAQAETLSCREGSKVFARTELYFGAGEAFHAAAWKRFLSSAVTPRFPDGFTVLDGHGQWRGLRGLEREASHMLIVVYPPDPAKDQALDEIREAYKRQFKQQSVLRVDSAVCVAF